jgi:RHS repeat-associated protein
VNSTPAIAASQYNGFNQLLAVSGPSGTTSFAYDGNGNQVSRTDGLGTTTYAYSYDNRLVGITGPGGSSHFEYDANGLRTKKADSSGTRSYLLDGLSVVAEYAPDASRLAWYTQSLARIDEVLSVVNGQGKYWYESDALGSTYAMTNAAGAVVSRSSYDVFGERSLAAGTDLGQPFGFTGREHDQSGLVYARQRYLSTIHGQWTQVDPAGMIDGPNRYGYVAGNPTGLSDPMGLCFWTAFEREFEFGLRANREFFSYGPWRDGFFAKFTVEKVIKMVAGFFVAYFVAKEVGLATVGDVLRKVLLPLLGLGGALEYSVGLGWATLGAWGTVGSAIALVLVKTFIVAAIAVVSVIVGSAIYAVSWALADDAPCPRRCE